MQSTWTPLFRQGWGDLQWMDHEAFLLSNAVSPCCVNMWGHVLFWCCIKNTQLLFETIAIVFFLLLVSSFAAAICVIYRGCFYSSELSEQLKRIKNKCPSSWEEWKRQKLDTKAEIPWTTKEERIKYSLFSTWLNRPNNSRSSLFQIAIWFGGETASNF